MALLQFSIVLHVTVFFFQAEDGIRAGHVTGVQTCALPILTAPEVANSFVSLLIATSGAVTFGGSPSNCTLADPAKGVPICTRSEERRVGKEWKTRRRGWGSKLEGRITNWRSWDVSCALHSR